MIVIKLQGGLGNQMFQYAAAKSLALYSGKTLVLDLSFLEQNIEAYDGFTPRNYELSIFNHNDIIFTNYSTSLKNSIYKLLSRIWSFFLKGKADNYVELNIRYDSKFFSTNFPVFISGFFQSEKYFKQFSSEIFKIFQFPKIKSFELDNVLAEIQKSQSVSIHIRRGDFVNSFKANSYHGVCDISYYNNSIIKINELIGTCNYFFFSDDIVWTKQNFKNIPNSFFVDSRSLPTWCDMFLMTQCNHNIVANSSYSWWGAWLNQNKQKVVIAPQNWFADNEMNSQIDDLIPREWIKL